MIKDDIIGMAVMFQLIATENRGGFYAEALKAFANFAAAHEREACAGLCDRFANRMMSAEECAAAIRARRSKTDEELKQAKLKGKNT
jgi:hypothetical protein